MKLIRFRVTNYRSVVDSGWIDVDTVTALIGVNESGKTNLLLPLWKLNPAREGEISPTSDYPKANYAQIRESPSKFTFIAAEFDTTELAVELSKISDASIESFSTVVVSRAFDGSFDLQFPGFNPTPHARTSEVKHILDLAVAEINGLTQLAKEGDLKNDVLATIAELDTGGDTVGAGPLAQLESNLKDLIPTPSAPTSTIVPRVYRLLEDLHAVLVPLTVADPSSSDDVKDLIQRKLPKFVFYSNYGNLDSEIYLPHVVENMKRKDLGAKEAAKARTLRVLFKFVRLEPSEILELGRDFHSPQGVAPTEQQIGKIAEKKRERTILLNSAGTDLTKKFRDWWKQGDYTFEFQADGDHFRIWVSDNKRPEKIELEDRSSGLQWFLSFYLVFLVESERDHSGAILLLDEPGLSLHPLAQRDLSAFFDGLSETNQLVYTTHSPFLVDADMLDRVRKVYVADDGSTKASSDLRRGWDDPRRAGATYAIYSALNMSVAESLLLGCDPVVVEGPSDQHYLSAIKLLLISAGQISPRREVVFPPAHGAGNAKVIASILTGRDEVMPTMLFDDDSAGRKMAKDMRNGTYQMQQDRVMTTKDWVDFEGSEVEDLFPAMFMAEVVDRWERRPETAFADVLKEGAPIVPQIEKWIADAGLQLSDGWKVSLAREVKSRALSKGATVFSETIPKWKEMFEKLMQSSINE